jgi:hypothetical protein
VPPVTEAYLTKWWEECRDLRALIFSIPYGCKYKFTLAAFAVSTLETVPRFMEHNESRILIQRLKEFSFGKLITKEEHYPQKVNAGRYAAVRAACRFAWTESTMDIVNVARYAAYAHNRDNSQRIRDIYEEYAARFRCLFHNPYQELPLFPHWLNPTIIQMAKNMQCDHELNNARFYMLADLLEEAGCTDTQILNHCRNINEYHEGYPGNFCWVLTYLTEEKTK